ncbi:MAG: bactofilin family protein [Gemmatimonadota bacterium]
MFGKDERDSDNGGTRPRDAMLRGREDERRVRAWIGASVVIEGDVTSSEDLTIAGRVEGDVAVRQNTLVISPEARIHGDIVARDVAVHGRVRGTITADGTVGVGRTGTVEGDVTTARMKIDEGASLKGKVEITGSPSRTS